MGYDVHALAEGESLVLGGVAIPHFQGTVAHSDGDVLIHALCDALLGAAALRDIGFHFPDTDLKYKGADSSTLLQEVVALLQERGFFIANVDATIAAQQPKINPYIPAMQSHLSQLMGIDVADVSLKASTTEQLGFEGREEGISVYAVALIEKHTQRIIPKNERMDTNDEMTKTEQQFDQVIAVCREIFIKKMSDYGPAWRILRPSSLTDQLYIKVKRIRSIQTKGESKVGESIDGEFVALVNYAAMGIIQLELGFADEVDMPKEKALELYDKYVEEGKQLMIRKNHDYGEAWRSMRVSSLADLILQKVYRTKQIEDNKGATLVSEGIDANYFDMLNYAVFALILIEEGN